MLSESNGRLDNVLCLINISWDGKGQANIKLKKRR